MKEVKIVKRPWGLFRQFILNKKCTVKILVVKPKQELSLQKHKKRTEMWYFLTEGIVQLGRKIKKIKKERLVKIRKGVAHRLIADNKEVKVLEISSGEFDDKDIIRLEDDYGRTGK